MDAKEEFIAKLYPAARKVSEETGMSWQLILAQVAQETGWGERILEGTNNIFNIKASGGWKGETKTFKVWEKVHGKVVWMDQDFRVYESIEDSLKDRVKFLSENPRYTKAGLFDEGTLGNLSKEANALQTAGYATDEAYAEELVKVFEGRTMRRSIALATGVDAPVGLSHSEVAARTLHPGHRSVSVGELQSRLHRLGYAAQDGAPLVTDNHYGQQTRQAVKAFQCDHLLTVDGIAGRATLAAVQEAVRTELRSIGESNAEYLKGHERDQALAEYQTLPAEPVVRDSYPGVMAASPRVDALQAAAVGHPDVDTTRVLQRNLNTLGVPDMNGQPLAAHGKYDDPTATAVARFQSEQGLPVTGLPDETTLLRAQSQAFIVDMKQTASPEAARHVSMMDVTQHSVPEHDTPIRMSLIKPLGEEHLQYVLSDPRHPESPSHELYKEMERCFPDASEDRRLQFTTACYANRITVDNLRGVYVDEDAMTVDIRGTGPLTTPVTIDMNLPPPKPEQAIEQIQSFDQREVQMMQEIQTQNMQLSQGGPTR